MLENLLYTVATTGAETPTVSAMEALITMFTTVFTFLGNCFSFILDQPVLLFIFAVGLVPVGFKIFRTVKNAVKK